MFEVGGTYANRIGKYTVLAVNPAKMKVRYEDGTVAELNVDIQRRIWENIVAEEEARAGRLRSAQRFRSTTQNVQHFIKPISLLAAEDLTFPGWRERVTASGEGLPDIRPGDRLIYYAIEPQAFFAVATVTGAAYEASVKEQSHKEGVPTNFFPIDIDAHAHDLQRAVPLDSVELESQPNFTQLLQQPDIYVKISEDDFELLAELLTEVAEEEEIEEEEEEEEEEDEE
ncbi:MAG: EVE domain-containing protein [Chloroflexota bacterium]